MFPYRCDKRCKWPFYSWGRRLKMLSYLHEWRKIDVFVWKSNKSSRTSFDFFCTNFPSFLALYHFLRANESLRCVGMRQLPPSLTFAFPFPAVSIHPSAVSPCAFYMYLCLVSYFIWHLSLPSIRVLGRVFRLMSSLPFPIRLRSFLFRQLLCPVSYS